MIWYIISHPLGLCVGTPTQILLCKGYNLWSGIVSDVGEVTLITALIATLVTLYKRHNCAVPRCPNLSHKKYEIKEIKEYTCKKHHTKYWHDLLIEQYKQDYPEQFNHIKSGA